MLIFVGTLQVLFLKVQNFGNFELSPMYLTLNNLMDFPIHIDTISMGLSSLHFLLEFSVLWCISILEGLF